MNTFIKGTVIGNVGKMSEIRYVKNDNALLDLSVATNESIKNQNGEWVQNTTWVNCTVWGRQAENCAKYLSVGNPVYLEGTMRLDNWEDKDGNTRTTLKMNVSDVRFVHDKSESQDEVVTSKPKAKAKAVSDDDEIAF